MALDGRRVCGVGEANNEQAGEGGTLDLCLLIAGWLKAVQVLMVLSLILCCLSFILFMFQLYTMRRGGLFYATGLCQLCTSEHCPLRTEGKGGGLSGCWGP